MSGTSIEVMRLSMGVFMSGPVSRTEVSKNLEGYGLTTAEIHYRLPEDPEKVVTYVWSDYDVAPEFPALNRFLDIWKKDLVGPLQSVQVAHEKLHIPRDYRANKGFFLLQ